MSVRVGIQKRAGKPKVDSLFVFTDLVCNLKCSHCYVKSSPGNRTLDRLGRDELSPFLEEAIDHGVGEVYFTGGEPFMSRDLMGMLEASLQVAPVTVYTNATAPLERNLGGVVELQQQAPHRLRLNVSFDSYDRAVHDEAYNRGRGNFDRAFENTVAAAQRGIEVAVTTQADAQLLNCEITAKFRDMFGQRDVRLSDVKVLPNIPQGRAESACATNPITPCELSAVKKELMCYSSRTLLKYKGKVHVFPCTILVPDSKEVVKDFARYDMGSTLAESFAREQPLDHPSCRTYCVTGGASCANRK